jgi:hypothetical protein
MDDVQRLFRVLVSEVAADASRLNGSLEVAEIYQAIVPYRTHRAQLQIDSIEDYEMAMLRLLAGERGLVELDPVEAQETLRAEVEAVHPDTGLFREFAGARVRLNGRAVAALLGEELRYAPPEEAAEAAVAADQNEPAASAASATPVFETVDALMGRPKCPDCHNELPTHVNVVFCPYCARQLVTARCRQCGEDVEPGWQYCVACGQPMTP